MLNAKNSRRSAEALRREGDNEAIHCHTFRRRVSGNRRGLPWTAIGPRSYSIAARFVHDSRMSTPLRALTNNYNDCSLIRLDPDLPSSPFFVMQTGYDSADPTFRMRVFYLQRDGLWIDEIARSTRPDSEAGDVVFETAGEAVKVLSALAGKPVIREVPVTAEDIQVYLARVNSGVSAQELLRGFLVRYRASKGKL